MLNAKERFLKYDYQNMLKFSSEQGAKLLDKLFQMKDECFWDQSYHSCSPTEKDLQKLRKETFFTEKVEKLLKIAREKSSIQVSKIRKIYAQFKSLNLYGSVLSGKLNFNELTSE